MKIAIIGAAGIRTPLLIRSLLKRQTRLGLSDISLMDIDAERLELIGALTSTLESAYERSINIQRTTNPEIALKDADYVITTFRVGGIDSRLIDEQVPLHHGVLGQETTGAGGFAMGIRSIPVLVDYVHLMQQLCPDAWLINFANPAGMLTEAILRLTDWKKVVGICDAPSTMQRVIASRLNVGVEKIFIDYFGLNHLGWIRSVIYQNKDYMPELLNYIEQMKEIPGFPFDPQFIVSLGLIPNEYLYYYYSANQAIYNILNSKNCRAGQLVKLNQELIDLLRGDFMTNNFEAMQNDYQNYLRIRGESYMVNETGLSPLTSDLDVGFKEAISDEGYPGVALDLIEALQGDVPSIQILNIPNHGSIAELGDLDVVEIPAVVKQNQVQPLPVTNIPDHCLGLMKQVKHFEHLTIEAYAESSYQKAALALTIHPLIRDYKTSKSILDDFIAHHGDYFPKLA